MAVTIDTGNLTTDSSASASSHSWSHTIVAGQVLFVAAGQTSNPLNPSTGVTYNSVSLTQHWQQSWSFAACGGYYHTSPATGSNTVAVTCSGSNGVLLGAAMGLDGVDTGDPVGTAVTDAARNNSPSVTVTDFGTGGDDLIIDALCGTTGSDPTVGADQTSIVVVSGSNARLALSSQPESAGGVMSYSWSANPYRVLGAAAWRAAAGAASLVFRPPVQRLMPLLAR